MARLASFLVRLELLIGFSQVFRLLARISVDWPVGLAINSGWLGSFYTDISDLPAVSELRLPALMFLSASVVLLVVFALRTFTIKAYNVELEADYVGDLERVCAWLYRFVFVRRKPYMQAATVYALLPILLLPLCAVMGWQVMWTAFFCHLVLLAVLCFFKYVGKKVKIVDADHSVVMSSVWVPGLNQRVTKETHGGIVETKKIRRLLTDGRGIPWNGFVVRCLGKMNRRLAYCISLCAPVMLATPLLTLHHPAATFTALMVWVVTSFWAFRKLAFCAAYHTMRTWQMFMTDAEILGQIIATKIHVALFLLCVLFAPAAGSTIFALKVLYAELNAGAGTGVILWCIYLLLPGVALALFWGACSCVRKEDAKAIRSNGLPVLSYTLLLVATSGACAVPGLLVWGRDLLEAVADLPNVGGFYCAEPVHGGCAAWAQSPYAMRCVDNKLCDVRTAIEEQEPHNTKVYGTPHPYIGDYYAPVADDLGPNKSSVRPSDAVLSSMAADLRSWVQMRGAALEANGQLPYRFSETPATMAMRRYADGVTPIDSRWASKVALLEITTSESPTALPTTVPTATKETGTATPTAVPTSAVVCSEVPGRCTACAAASTQCCTAYFAKEQPRCDRCVRLSGCEAIGYTPAPTALPTTDQYAHWPREWRVNRMGAALADSYYDYPLQHPLRSDFEQSGSHGQAGAVAWLEPRVPLRGCPANCTVHVGDGGLHAFRYKNKVQQSLVEAQLKGWGLSDLGYEDTKYAFQRWALFSFANGGSGTNLALRLWPKRRLDLTSYYYDEYYDVVDKYIKQAVDGRAGVAGYAARDAMYPERHYHLQSYGETDGVGGMLMVAWAVVLAPFVLLLPCFFYLAADATITVVSRHRPSSVTDAQTGKRMGISMSKEYELQLQHARANHTPVMWRPCGAPLPGSKDTMQDEDDEDEQKGSVGAAKATTDENIQTGAWDDGEEGAGARDYFEDNDDGLQGGIRDRKRRLCRSARRRAALHKEQPRESWLANRLLRLVGMHCYGSDEAHYHFAWDAAGMLRLIEPFRRRAWWWQAIDLGKRLLLLLILAASSPTPMPAAAVFDGAGNSDPYTAASAGEPTIGRQLNVFASGLSTREQLLCAAVVLAPFLLSTVLLRPYQDKQAQMLSVLTQCANLLQLAVGIAITDGYLEKDSPWMQAPLGLACVVFAGVAGSLLGMETQLRALVKYRRRYKQLSSARFLFEQTKLGKLNLLQAWDRMIPCQTPGKTFPKPQLYVGLEAFDSMTEKTARADHVTVLSVRGPPPECYSLLHAAVKHTKPDIVQWLLKIDMDLKMTQGMTTAERLVVERQLWLKTLTPKERALEEKREMRRLATLAGLSLDEYKQWLAAEKAGDGSNDGGSEGGDGIADATQGSTSSSAMDKGMKDEGSGKRHNGVRGGGVSTDTPDGSADFYAGIKLNFQDCDASQSKFDSNGVLFHIGTEGGRRRYENPHETCEVTARMSSIDDGGSTHGRNILHGHPSRFVMHALPGKEAIFKAKMKIQGEMSVGDPYNYTRPVDPYAADGGSPNISMYSTSGSGNEDAQHRVGPELLRPRRKSEGESKRGGAMGDTFSWMSVDLGEGRALVPNHYCIRHGFGASGLRGQGRLRSWILQGSPENRLDRDLESTDEPAPPAEDSWVTIRTHTNDKSIAGIPYAVTDFEIKQLPILAENKGKGAPEGVAFRHFRIVMTGPNSTGTWHLHCSGIELYGELFDGDRRAMEHKLHERHHQKERAELVAEEERRLKEIEVEMTGVSWGKSESQTGGRYKSSEELKKEEMAEAQAIERARRCARAAAATAAVAHAWADKFKRIATEARLKAEADAAPTPAELAEKERTRMEARADYTELSDIVDGSERTPLDLAIQALTDKWMTEREVREERKRKNPLLAGAEQKKENRAKSTGAGADDDDELEIGSTKVTKTRAVGRPMETHRHGEDHFSRERKKREIDAKSHQSALWQVVEEFAKARAGMFVGMQRVKTAGYLGSMGYTELVPNLGLHLEQKYPLVVNHGADLTIVALRALAPCMRTLVRLDVRGAGLGLVGGMEIVKIFSDAADAHKGVRDERRKFGFPVAIRYLDLRCNRVGPKVRKALAVALLRLGGLAIMRGDRAEGDQEHGMTEPGRGGKRRRVCLSRLRELRMDCWSVGDLRDESTVLDLENQNISRDDVLLLAGVLQATSSLTAVNLARNKLGFGDQHECGQALGMLLQVLDFHHSNMCHLNLHANHIKGPMLSTRLSTQLTLGTYGGLARQAQEEREERQLPPSFFLMFEHSYEQRLMLEKEKKRWDQAKVQVTLVDLLLCPYRKFISTAVESMPIHTTAIDEHDVGGDNEDRAVMGTDGKLQVVAGADESADMGFQGVLEPTSVATKKRKWGLFTPGKAKHRARRWTKVAAVGPGGEEEGCVEDTQIEDYNEVLHQGEGEKQTVKKRHRRRNSLLATAALLKDTIEDERSVEVLRRMSAAGMQDVDTHTGKGTDDETSGAHRIMNGETKDKDQQAHGKGEEKEGMAKWAQLLGIGTIKRAKGAVIVKKKNKKPNKGEQSSIESGSVDGGAVVGLGLSLTSLDLSQNNMEGDALLQLARWVRFSPTLTHLDVSSNNIGTSYGAHDLSESAAAKLGSTGQDHSLLAAHRLPTTPSVVPSPTLVRAKENESASSGAGEQMVSIEHERLEWVKLCRRGVDDFLNSVAASCSLITLGFSNTRLGGWKDKLLVRSVGTAIGKVGKLCELSLQSCRLSSSDLKVMATAIRFAGASSIATLDLSGNRSIGVMPKVEQGLVLHRKGWKASRGSGKKDAIDKLIDGDDDDSRKQAEGKRFGLDKLTLKELEEEVHAVKSGVEVFASALANMPKLQVLRLRGCRLCGITETAAEFAAADKPKGGAYSAPDLTAPPPPSSGAGKVAGTYSLDGLEALCKALCDNAKKAGKHDLDHSGVLVHGLEEVDFSDNLICSGGISLIVSEWLLPTCLHYGKTQLLMPEAVTALANSIVTRQQASGVGSDVSAEGHADLSAEDEIEEQKHRRRLRGRRGSVQVLAEGAVTATMGAPGRLAKLGLRRTGACTAYKYAHEVGERAAAKTTKEKVKRKVNMLRTMRRISLSMMSGKGGKGKKARKAAGVGQEGKVGGFDADLLCAAVRRASELKLERTAQAAAVKEAELNEEQEKLKSSMGITKLRLLRGAAAAAGGKAHHHALLSTFAMASKKARELKEQQMDLIVQRRKKAKRVTNFFFTKFDAEALEMLCKTLRAGLRNQANSTDNKARASTTLTTWAGIIAREKNAGAPLPHALRKAVMQGEGGTEGQDDRTRAEKDRRTREADSPPQTKWPFGTKKQTAKSLWSKTRAIAQGLGKKEQKLLRPPFSLDLSDNDMREQGIRAALSLVGVITLADLDLRCTGSYKDGPALLWGAIEPQLMKWRQNQKQWANAEAKAELYLRTRRPLDCIRLSCMRQPTEPVSPADDPMPSGLGGGNGSGTQHLEESSQGGRRKSLALSGLFRDSEQPRSTVLPPLSLHSKSSESASSASPFSLPALPAITSNKGIVGMKGVKQRFGGFGARHPNPIDPTGAPHTPLSSASTASLSAHQQRVSRRKSMQQTDGGLDHYLATTSLHNPATGLRSRGSRRRTSSAGLSPSHSLPTVPITTSRTKVKVKVTRRRKVLSPDGKTVKKKRKVVYELVSTPRGTGNIERKRITPVKQQNKSQAASEAGAGSPRRKRSSAAREGVSEVYSSSANAKLKLANPSQQLHTPLLEPIRRKRRTSLSFKQAADISTGSSATGSITMPPSARNKNRVFGSDGGAASVMPVYVLNGIPLAQLLGGHHADASAMSKEQVSLQAALSLEQQQPQTARIAMSRIGSMLTGVSHLLELRLMSAGLGVVECCVLGQMLQSGAGAQLFVLDLRKNPAITVGWGEDGAGVVVGVVRRRLKRLVRIGNELKGLRALADAVVQHPRLREFDLRCCALGWKGGGERDLVKDAREEEQRVAAWVRRQLQKRQKVHAAITYVLEWPADVLVGSVKALCGCIGSLASIRTHCEDPVAKLKGMSHNLALAIMAFFSYFCVVLALLSGRTGTGQHSHARSRPASTIGPQGSLVPDPTSCAARVAAGVLVVSDICWSCCSLLCGLQGTRFTRDGSRIPPSPPKQDHNCLAILQRVWQESARLKLINGMPLRALRRGRIKGRSLDLSGQRLGDLELQLLLPVMEHTARVHGWRSLRQLDLRSNAFLLPPHAELDGSSTDRTLHAHPSPIGTAERLFRAVNGFCAPHSTNVDENVHGSKAIEKEKSKKKTEEKKEAAIAKAKAAEENGVDGTMKSRGLDADMATALISSAATDATAPPPAHKPRPGFIFNGIPVRRQLPSKGGFFAGVPVPVAGDGDGGTNIDGRSRGENSIDGNGVGVLASVFKPRSRGLEQRTRGQLLNNKRGHPILPQYRPQALADDSDEDVPKEKSAILDKNGLPVFCRHFQMKHLCKICSRPIRRVLGVPVNEFAPVSNAEAYDELQLLEKLKGLPGKRLGPWGGTLLVALLRELSVQTKERITQLDLRHNHLVGRGKYDDGGYARAAAEDLCRFHGGADVHSLLSTAKEDADKGAQGESADAYWRQRNENFRRKCGLEFLLALVRELTGTLHGEPKYPVIEAVLLEGNGIDADVAAMVKEEVAQRGYPELFVFEGNRTRML